MKTLWKLYRTGRLIRPTVYWIIFKAAILLGLSLLWDRFLDKGARGMSFGLGILSVILLALAWFHYLALDGVRIHHLLEKPKKEKKSKVRAHDIIDFVDEPAEFFSELTRDEKSACHLVSSFLTGLAGFLISLILP